MLSWFKEVLGHKKPKHNSHSHSSPASWFRDDDERLEYAEDGLNVLGREDFCRINNDYHVRHLRFPKPPSPTSPSAPPPSSHSPTRSPSSFTYVSDGQDLQLARWSQSPTPSSTQLTPLSITPLETLVQPPSSGTSNAYTLSTSEAEMPLESQQSPTVPGKDFGLGQENQSKGTFQAAADGVLRLTDDQDSHPSCFLTTVLTSHIGQLFTEQDEKYVLVRVKGKVQKVSLNGCPCHVPPCRLVWRGGQTVSLVELPDSTFVEIDAVLCPETKELHAALIWQDTKPERCLQLLDNTYMFLDSRRVICWPRYENMVAKNLSVVFDGTIVSAEVCDAVVFIGEAKATLDELLQHDSSECNATVYKVLEGTGGGRVLYVCTCLWVGQMPPISSLPMLIKKQTLYSKESHGLYSKSERKTTLCLDVDASLCVSSGTATIQMEVDGLRRSLKATHPLGLELGCQKPGETTRVNVHVSKEKLGKKLVGFSAVMIKLSDSAGLDAILNKTPPWLYCPSDSNDTVRQVCENTSGGHNADDHQIKAASSLKYSVPVPQNYSVPAAQKTAGIAAEKTPNTAAQKTHDTTAQKNLSTAAPKKTNIPAQKIPDTGAQKTPNTAAQKTPNTAAQKTPNTAAQKTPNTAGQKIPDPATPKTPKTAAQKTPDPAAQKANTAAQKTTGKAAKKASRKAAKTNTKSASLSQLSSTQQEWGYLTCSVLAADNSLAVVTGAGRKIFLARADLFVNDAPLTINHSVSLTLKKFQNVAVIYIQSPEVHDVLGHSVDHLTVAAWLGKKTSFINDIIEQRLAMLKKVATPKVTQGPSATPKTTKVPPATPKVTQASPATPKVTQASPATPKVTQASPATPKVTQASSATPKVTQASPATPKVTQASPAAPKVTQAQPGTPKVKNVLHTGSKLDPVPPAAIKVTQTPPSAPKVTPIQSTAPKVTPDLPAANSTVGTKVDATCMIMKISQNCVTLVVRSKFLPGNCGTAQTRLSDIYENGIPMTQTKAEEVRDKVWHCQLLIKNDGKQLMVPMAWRGKKPVNTAASSSPVSQQTRQALSTGDLTSTFVRDDLGTPVSSPPKVMTGEVTEVLAEGGRLKGEDGRHYPFSLEVCFLFGVCLHQIKPRQVLRVGMMVEFEVVTRSRSSSSEDLVQRVCVEGENASLNFPPTGSMIDTWCSDNGVPLASHYALKREAELLSPSLFPTAQKLEETTTIDITT